MPGVLAGVVAGGGKDGGAGVDAAEQGRAVGENGGKNILLHGWANEYLYSSGRPRRINYPPLTVIRDRLGAS